MVAMLLVMPMAGCNKYDKEGAMDMPGVALTFDDNSIDNWYSYMPLLDSFGVKATFYISAYHKLSRDQKQKLHDIQSRGHEIAFHTTNHYDMVSLLGRLKMKDLMESEIYQDLKKMNRDGFYPHTFAYPYGSHNEYLDHELCKLFKSVRALNGSNNFTKSFTRGCSNKVLYAIGIDNDRRSLGKIEFLIDCAFRNRNCLMLVGHQIEKADAKFQISYEKLKAILQKTKSLNMRFYTVSEISL
jgi:peptidoglycan/xylan/chitin deacetylase (PgdA/CDA1 family)